MKSSHVANYVIGIVDHRNNVIATAGAVDLKAAKARIKSLSKLRVILLPPGHTLNPVAE